MRVSRLAVMNSSGYYLCPGVHYAHYVHPVLADSLLHILCCVASTYGPYGFPLYTINMQGVCERIHAVLPGEFTIII